MRRARSMARPYTKPRSGQGGRRSDQGAATIVALALGAVLLFAGMAGAFVAAVTAAHRTAQAAADLAALAAAQAVQHGSDGCAEASEIATRNRARLRTCHVTGEEVWIEVVVPSPSWAGYDSPEVIGRAHAGPG
ncbi:Rv3654c family TadE-like protein [Nocardioides dubius]|uniref:Putative Flp pilus-assembly TadG-like N-terminal domain-containing protein n=1 Tax=Nocardioides dubius TaxID=317019 RepID=A0ABN1U205_9ACTN